MTVANGTLIRLPGSCYIQEESLSGIWPKPVLPRFHGTRDGPFLRLDLSCSQRLRRCERISPVHFSRHGILFLAYGLLRKLFSRPLECSTFSHWPILFHLPSRRKLGR